MRESLFTTIFTPPAILLNIWAIVGQNVNILLVILISILSVCSLCLKIRNQNLEKRKNEIEIEILKKKQTDK
jgi:hypothetical protein